MPPPGARARASHETRGPTDVGAAEGPREATAQHGPRGRGRGGAIDRSRRWRRRKAVAGLRARSNDEGEKRRPKAGPLGETSAYTCARTHVSRLVKSAVPALVHFLTLSVGFMAQLKDMT